MACSTKHCELAIADKTARMVVKREHFGRSIGNGRLLRLLLRRERKSFEILGSCCWILGDTLLVGVDGRNPQVRGRVVVHSCS